MRLSRSYEICLWASLLILEVVQSIDPEIGTVELLHARQSPCRYIEAKSGDDCNRLATQCSISWNDFTQFNSVPNICYPLQIGQLVCCSSGSLPDFSPKPNADGSCASYIVQDGESCAKIASSNSITVDDIERFNRNTWGWRGCNPLFTGIALCLSDGTPPMPPPISTAVCGPQVPGTRNPGPGINIAELNPCPLKACCNIYGNCGINEDFCDTSSARNKCISNCGQQITNNQVPPKEFIRVGYFQAYNKERPCLHMDVTQVPNTFTHLHFAFADIVAGFEVSVSNIQEQFDKFVKITDKKRILSIGGASSSTDPSRARILRDTIDATNRETVATNLANFVTEHNLDGLDLDYEFFEVQGLPSFNAADGLNLSQLLKALRAKLPNKILTIAVPASYYYLQHLPIRSISNVVDYIVYMTYDLHGQWDYGSPWASSGCPAGNCLRSHVNMTETTTALAIITKSGVKANKIVVGVTSYGRSFRMTSPSCAGPMCTFTGPASGATPGRCTTTPGILANAEIKEILANNPDADATWDGFESDSNVLIFATQWVSYMDDTNKNNRIARYKMNNFGGTVDWAVDLDSFIPGNS